MSYTPAPVNELTVGNKKLTAGSPFNIKGRRGRRAFHWFQRLVVDGEGVEWIEAKDAEFRSRTLPTSAVGKVLAPNANPPAPRE